MYVQMIGGICGSRVIGKDNKNGGNSLDIGKDNKNGGNSLDIGIQ